MPLVHLGGTIVAINRQGRIGPHGLGNLAGEVDARTDGDKVYVLGITTDNDVTHIAAHDIALAPHGIGNAAHGMEYL